MAKGQQQEADTDGGGGSLAGDPSFMEFMAASEDADGGQADGDGDPGIHGDTLDASGDDDYIDHGATRRTEEGDTDDTEGDDVTTDGPSPRDRLVLRLADQGRQLSEVNKEVRTLRAENAALKGRASGYDPHDRVGSLRTFIKGAGADERAELEELLQDLVLETTDDALLSANPELARRKQERQRDVAARRDRTELQRRIDQIEAEKLQAQRTAAEANAVSHIDGMIRASAGDHPLLLSQAEEGGDGDPARLVYAGLEQLARAGHDLSTDAAADAAARHVMKNLERYYRSQAERYAAVYAADADDGREKRTRGPKKQASDGRRRTNQSTITSSRSAGGRGAPPPPRATDEEETMEEFLQRSLREDQAARRTRRRR